MKGGDYIMSLNKTHLAEELVKKYYRIITEQCIKSVPKIEDAFEIRVIVVTRLFEIITQNKEV